METAPIRTRGGRGLLIAGIVIAAVALISGVTCGAMVARSVAGPMTESLTAPARPTPVDAQLSLKAGRYTVFELVGRRSSHGPVTTSRTRAGTVTPDMIGVTDPEGATITVDPIPSGHSESLDRNGEIYRAVALFVVAEPGPYHVLIDSPEGRQVVVAPTFGSGFGPVLGWLFGAIASFPALLLGVVLLIVGAVQAGRSRNRRAAVTGASGPYSGPPLGGAGTPGQLSAPPAGWYPAPDVADRQRYWDGRTWTDQLR
jgi:hypothetical protein